MSFNFRDLSKTNLAQSVLKQAGLNPPPDLLRKHEQWHEKPFLGEEIILLGGGFFIGKLAKELLPLGADFVTCDDRLVKQLSETKNFTISKRELTSIGTIKRLIFDASSILSTDQLGSLYETFSILAKNLGPNSRIVFINRPQDQMETLQESTAWAAVEGFFRSFSKEIAVKGGIAQLLTFEDQSLALQRGGGAFEFFLSDYATYITGQILNIQNRAAGKGPYTLAGSLAGKVALVTGAAGGIGKAAAQSLFHEGCHVYCVDHPGALGPLRELANAIEGEALTVDFNEHGPEKYIINQLQASAKKIDIIIHCAGITRDKTIKNTSKRSWDEVINVNLQAVLAINSAFIEEKLISNGGRIITLSSISGIAGNFGQTSYAASKAGLIGYSRALAQTVADRGITVNAVAPGFIETPMTAKVPAINKFFYKRLSILSQAGLPEDVAHGICFLASPAASGITGQTLRICGGHVMGV